MDPADRARRRRAAMEDRRTAGRAGERRGRAGRSRRASVIGGWECAVTALLLLVCLPYLLRPSAVRHEWAKPPN